MVCARAVYFYAVQSVGVTQGRGWPRIRSFSATKIAPTPVLVRAGMDRCQAAILAHGGCPARHFIEYFTATIRNRITRMAYARAVKQFFDWCEDSRLGFDDIHPIVIGAYIEQLGTNAAKPMVKQNLAASGNCSITL